MRTLHVMASAKGAACTNLCWRWI